MVLKTILKPQIMFESPTKGGMSNKFIGVLQRGYWTLDGVLKPL